MTWVSETKRTRRWLPWAAAALAILAVLTPGSPAAAQSDEIERLETLCRSQPRNADARFELGSELLKARRYEKAIAAFETTASLQERAGSPDPKTYNALGWTQMLAGDYRAAEKALRKAMEHEGSADVTLRRKIFNNLGVLYIRMSDYDRARQFLTRAADLGSATARRELAKLQRLEASG